MDRDIRWASTIDRGSSRDTAFSTVAQVSATSVSLASGGHTNRYAFAGLGVRMSGIDSVVAGPGELDNKTTKDRG